MTINDPHTLNNVFRPVVINGGGPVPFPEESAFTTGGPPKSPAAKILETASSLIDGDRDRQHGNRKECIRLIAAHWSLEVGTTITERQVCRMMTQLKLVRDKTGAFTTENATDGCGYMAMGGEFGLSEAD